MRNQQLASRSNVAQRKDSLWVEKVCLFIEEMLPQWKRGKGRFSWQTRTVLRELFLSGVNIEQVSFIVSVSREKGKKLKRKKERMKESSTFTLSFFSYRVLDSFWDIKRDSLALFSSMTYWNETSEIAADAFNPLNSICFQSLLVFISEGWINVTFFHSFIYFW